MFHSLKKSWRNNVERLSRREWMARGSLLTLPALFAGELTTAAADSSTPGTGQDVYGSIGVLPLINARLVSTLPAAETNAP